MVRSPLGNGSVSFTNHMNVTPLTSGNNALMSVLPLGDSVLEEWSDWMRAAGLAPKTVHERPQLIARLESYLGRPATTATTRDLLKFLGAQNWGQSTRHTHQTTLKAFYGWATKQGIIADDPTTRLPKVRVPRPAPRPITRDQLDAMLALPGLHSRTRSMIILCAYQGLRVHETAKFASWHLDLSSRSVEVTGKGSVTEYLPASEHVLREAELYSGYWFPNWKANKRFAAGEGHILGNSVSNIISQVMKRAGVPGTPHSLRHFYATELLRNGVDIRIIQRLMRHASLNSTQIYTQVLDDQMRDAQALID